MQLRKNEAENGAEQLQQRSSKKETRDNGAHKKDVVEYGYYNAYQGEKRKNSSFGFGFVWLWRRYQHWHDYILNLDFHAPCSFWLTSGKVWHFLFNMVPLWNINRNQLRARNFQLFNICKWKWVSNATWLKKNIFIWRLRRPDAITHIFASTFRHEPHEMCKPYKRSSILKRKWKGDVVFCPPQTPSQRMVRWCQRIPILWLVLCHF